ncbi:MAG: MFS transporter [Planctomycetes bacterium]|nr:MFS transporter [Planctomycetota bacterium]
MSTPASEPSAPSPTAPDPTAPPRTPPGRIAYLVLLVGITALAAFWLYIDRVCFSTLADPIQKDLAISDDQKSYILGAFFLTYALFQIPMGTLADRFGPRTVLALSIVAWSMVTAATGLVGGFAVLIAVRLTLGITESGAYPAAAALIKRWAPAGVRGLCSSAVALGGRLGGAVAPFLTAWLAVALVGFGLADWANNPAGVNWRGVFVLYGSCGVAVAVLFWLVVRDHPPQVVGPPPAPAEGEEPDWHAMPPAKEAPAPGAPVPFAQQLGKLARSRNMWLFGAVQMCVNLGWVFVITLLPTYLSEAFEMSLKERGKMQTVVLVIGCCGMFFGGMLTDGLRAWLGPRLGRTVPLGVALGGCAVSLLLVPTFSSVWPVVGALGLMAFLVDLHNPTIWSFAQDVGGKNVGAALGWGNMWGNLGAALSPAILINLRNAAGWDAAFIFCGVAFACAATCGLALDATKPVDGPGGPTSPAP